MPPLDEGWTGRRRGKKTPPAGTTDYGLLPPLEQQRTGPRRTPVPTPAARPPRAARASRNTRRGAGARLGTVLGILALAAPAAFSVISVYGPGLFTPAAPPPEVRAQIAESVGSATRSPAFSLFLAGGQDPARPGDSMALGPAGEEPFELIAGTPVLSPAEEDGQARLDIELTALNTGSVPARPGTEIRLALVDAAGIPMGAREAAPAGITSWEDRAENLLNPGESVTATLRFTAPTDVISGGYLQASLAGASLRARYLPLTPPAG